MHDPTPVLPADLEPTARGVLSGHGGVTLAYARWEHPEPKGRVVISHGYGEHGERYRHTARWLHGLGWSVSAMDHSGFGRSGGIRGDAHGIRAFVDDFALFLRQERRHDAGRTGAAPRVVDGVPMPPLPVCPQVVLGHSFGGLVALLTLLWHADTLDGLILSSPSVAVRSNSKALVVLSRLLNWLMPHRPIQLHGDKSRVCSDPVLVQRYQTDPLCHRWATAAFGAALDEGRAELLPLGQELDRPMLLLESGEDTVVDPDASEALWSAVKPGLLERHRLPGFYHEVFHDRRRAEAQALAEPWLDHLYQAWNPSQRPRNPSLRPAMSEMLSPESA
ncbi:MAG TPA: lysophospholipase [Geothrix sp.]|uniref:alpha/beta hydrolase n=1 Tax=Geothrix mesophila TaxID=2922723 RepID=UPI001FADE9D2|nr:alpha/beta hydrolase [Geothrix sp. SG198]HJV39238.1 lysophospholipase [Geothrix sp.]